MKVGEQFFEMMDRLSHDKDGFTQQRWVDDGSSSNSIGHEPESSKSYFDHTVETVREAIDHLNDSGKARQIQDDLDQYR